MPELPDPDQQASGGGTETGIINITKLTTTSFQATHVQNQLRWVKQVLLEDSTCSDWLKDNQADISWMLGDTPESTMKVGVGVFSDNSTNAVAGTGGTNLVPGSMSITVNVNGAFFNANAGPMYGTTVPPGTFEAQVFILLHELAHITEAAGFRGRDNNPVDQTWNNQLVLENCGATVRRAAGGYQ